MVVEIWQLGVLMSTPCCQISTPYRLVVSEYEVPKVFVCKSDTFFLVHPVHVFLLLCVLLCLKYFSENHTMVEFEINTPRSNKILPSVLPKYSSRRREYFGRTRGSILLLRGVFIKIFIEWWSRKTPRRQPRGFSWPPRDEYRSKLNELANNERKG